jgi:putative transposase
VVGWGLSNSLDAENSLNVLRQEIGVFGTPEIVNSDQDSQFTCPERIEYLKGQKIVNSMDGKGRYLDSCGLRVFGELLNTIA